MRTHVSLERHVCACLRELRRIGLFLRIGSGETLFDAHSTKGTALAVLEEDKALTALSCSTSVSARTR